MRKNFGSRPMAFPMPVYIIGTYDENGTPDAMNAAWGGISGDNKITICVDKGHKTAANVVARKAFTVSMAIQDQLVACDYVGIVSGNDVPDKFEKAGFHMEKSENVDAPLIRELPLALECKMVSYDEGSEVLVGEIVNVCADESVLTDGKVDVAKLKPLVYDCSGHGYYSMSELVGYAHKDGKKLM